MTSFHKVIDSQDLIGGTKFRNNLYSVSSGIPSLDHVVGGGLPAGSIFGIEEDIQGDYSRVLIKYFLAEGVVSKHDIFIASIDEDPNEIIQKLPQQCATLPQDEASAVINDVDNMKIAWRYEGLNKVESSFGNNTHFGHHFDLSKYMDDTTTKQCNITYWTPDVDCKGSNEKGLGCFINEIYYRLLLRIKKIASKEEYCRGKGKKNILRLVIQSLGSPSCLAIDCCDEDLQPSCYYGQDLLQFIYCLKVLLRDTYIVAFITIQSHVIDDPILVNKLLYSIDNAVKIESFVGSSRETNPLYKDYNGLFHVTKLSALHTLAPFVPPSQDMAFKLRRKKFIIEKLHLPPELQDSSEREQDDITATPPSCGSFKKKDIDF